MESLRKLGEVFRNHYEKIGLTLVLVGLAVAVVFVWKKSESEKQKIDASVTQITNTAPTPVPPVDTGPAEAALKLVQAPPELNFGPPHNLVNPVKWKQKPDGTRTKIVSQDEIGWPKMFITRLTPLKLLISLDRIPSPGGYYVGLIREAAERPIDRKKRQIFATLNVTNKFLDRLVVLREIKGPPEKPEELIIELADTNERISVAPDKPFVRIEGYEADIKHELTQQGFQNLRVGTVLKFHGDDYIIVAVNPNEVVASARATEKRYTVRQFAPATNGTNKVAQPAAVSPQPVAPPPPTGATPPPPQ